MFVGWLFLFVFARHWFCRAFVSTTYKCKSNNRLRMLSGNNNEIEVKAKKMLQRTERHLNRLQNIVAEDSTRPQDEETIRFEEEQTNLIQSYIKQSSNKLKELLRQRKLSDKGAKPTLAQRLAIYDLQPKYPHLVTVLDFKDDAEQLSRQDALLMKQQDSADAPKLKNPLTTFGSIHLSKAAGIAFQLAGFTQPSPIQQLAFPLLLSKEKKNYILHAETGSGKTLAYLLPITEQLWHNAKNNKNNDEGNNIVVVLTPTRELAAQVAGVATAIAPPGTVRLITQPSNLLTVGKDRSVIFQDDDTNEQLGAGRVQRTDIHGGTSSAPKLFIGSAKVIYTSLYGDGKMPAPPTPKPLAMYFLKCIQVLVLDEVDRLLDISSSSSTITYNNKENTQQEKKSKQKRNHVHEKPAAIIGSAASRFTLGKVQVIAASATVGRPLRRELSRVLGLAPQECPETIRADNAFSTPDLSQVNNQKTNKHIGRAVTIPSTVKNYVLPINGTTSGSLLVASANIAKQLSSNTVANTKILLVLTKKCGLSVHETVGALKHFGVKPTPRALLDALLTSGEGRGAIDSNDPDGLIEVHRKVSGAYGVGVASNNNMSYLLVAGEESIRGLHLDGLDTVIVIGRADNPDEYSHVAGRTGRMGQKGRVINVVFSDQNSLFFTSWEKMLMIKFLPLSLSEIANLEQKENAEEEVMQELHSKRIKYLSSAEEGSA